MSRAKIGIVIIVLFVAGISGYIVFAISKHNKPESVPEQTTQTTPKLPSEEGDLLTHALSTIPPEEVTQEKIDQKRIVTSINFDLVKWYFALPGTGGKFVDGVNKLQLMAVYTDGSEHLALEDLETLFPEMYKNYASGVNFVSIFNSSLDHTKLTFEPYVNDRQQPVQDLYVFDLKTGGLRFSTISKKIFESYKTSGVSGYAAPNGTNLAVFIPNPKGSNGLVQELYLIDLYNDKIRLFKKFEGTDTLNAGTEQVPVFDVLPLGDAPRTIRLGVFDQSLKRPDYNAQSNHGQSIVKTYLDIEIPKQ